MIVQLLSGVSCLFIDGYNKCLTIDCRTYRPEVSANREKTKLCVVPETVLWKLWCLTQLLSAAGYVTRKLIVEILTAGESSHTDIAMCYMEGRADKKLIEKDQKKDTDRRSRCPFHESGKSCRMYFSRKMVQSIS